MNTTKAMILAGGMSTRLYPLTKQVPKPLVPVAGEPISAHIMRWLASFGYTEVAINVHYLSDAIEAAFGDGSRYGVELNYLHEAELMGSAGAVKPLEPFFDRHVRRRRLRRSDRCEFGRAGRPFTKSAARLATIGLVEAEEVDQYGVVITDERGRIIEFQEKPPKGTERSKLVNTGIYVFEPEIFDYIPAGDVLRFRQAAFFRRCWRPARLLRPCGWTARTGATSARRKNTVWRPTDVLAGRVRLRGARATGVPAGVRSGNDVRIEGDVRLGSNVSVGRRVRIVGPTVIGDDVTHRRRSRHRAFDRVGCARRSAPACSCATPSSASTTTSRPTRRSSTASSRTNRSRPNSRERRASS